MRRGGVRPERGEERRSCCGLLYKEARCGGKMSRRETVAAAEGQRHKVSSKRHSRSKVTTYIYKIIVHRRVTVRSGHPVPGDSNIRDDKSKILSNKRCLVLDGSKEGEDGREEKDTFNLLRAEMHLLASRSCRQATSMALLHTTGVRVSFLILRQVCEPESFSQEKKTSHTLHTLTHT